MKFLILLAALAAAPAWAAPVKTEHVEAELVAASTAAEPGKPLALALRLKMIPHWHTYWRNPGDSGQPTAIEWKLPAGWRAGEIQWPAPRRLPAAHLMNFGYEDEVLLPVDVAVPAGASGAATLSARATWLVCSAERCVPEEGDFTLSIPLGKGEPTTWAGPIERTRQALPVKAGSDWRFEARRSERGVELGIVPPAGVSPAAFAYFPFEEGKIRNAGAQPLERDGERFVLSLEKSDQPAGAFTRVSGLLVAQGLPRALEIDVPVEGVAGPSGLSGLWLAIAFAFAGGIILNLMPCVLPVLSIKILGFASGGDRGAMRRHGALYAAGVIASFLAFAGALLAFKGLGSQIGWGFQLQSPVFVALLAVLFLVLALNLSGVFEFGSIVPQRLAMAGSRHPGADAFLTGVLAVAIASPCTAPFMGAALGYALGTDAATALAVFAALGIGMALPYVLLAWHPAWLRWVPKPGQWMVRFKQALAVPLYATVVWLGWVLAIQAGALAPASAWEKFTEPRRAALVASGRPVFVDFTAAWCVTCQVNKQLVLDRADVAEAFRSRNVALLRADWTRRDAEITRSLAALGRNGVPVYALYAPGREPQLLPEVLTRDALLAALERLSVKEPRS